MDVDAIAEAIDRRRRELHLTLTQVRDRAGISQSQVSLMANAKGTSYRTETLAAVSRALDWPADMLERIGDGTNYPDELSEDDKFTAIMQRLEQNEQTFSQSLLRVTEAIERLSDRL